MWFFTPYIGNVWIENTFLDSGKTCSTGERVYNDEATLDECKAEAIELEGSYIYWQSNADRNNNGALCHIYTSCDTTRTPAMEGTNYEYGFWSSGCNWSNGVAGKPLTFQNNSFQQSSTVSCTFIYLSQF